MTSKIITAPLGLMLATMISACTVSSSSSDGKIDRNLQTRSQLVLLTESGDIPEGYELHPNSNAAVGYKRVQNGAGFAYQMGRVRNTDEFVAVAGILRENNVGGTPTVATARYEGRYNLSYANRSRFDEEVSGRITLDADFTRGTLTGQSGRLTVDGTIIGRGVGGTASYRGVEGRLTGSIGDARAVGAFSGNDRNAAFAGGFIADRQTNQND